MRQFLELVKAWSRAALQWLTELPLWIKYDGLVVLVAALGSLLIWKWGFRKQIDTGLIGRSAERDVDTLWFLRDGTLAGTSSGSSFNVSLWPNSDLKRTPFDRLFQIDDFYNF